jgi:glycosyltransferase involved in cell wall biosynthesis
MSEIITNGRNGILAKPADSQDLSEKIQLLLSNWEQRLEIGKNAYDYVREEHNWDRQIEKYAKVYSGLAH